MAPCWCGLQKMRKWLYLSPRPKIEKTKGTFFSLTFKVRENKLPLCLSILALGLRYSHFLIFCWQHQKVPSKNLENGYISAPEPKLKKLRALCFLQLLKFEKRKPVRPTTGTLGWAKSLSLYGFFKPSLIINIFNQNNFKKLLSTLFDHWVVK